MPECAVCGGAEFTPHDGFYYCVECQTQSQDIRQLEMSFRPSQNPHRQINVRIKKRGPKKVRSSRLGGGPPWTSWQAFNYILRGMTSEIVALKAPEDFEITVLRLWACYLKVHEVAFTSFFQERPPRLGFPFRYRDGKVLYDIDTNSSYSRKKAEKKGKKNIKKKEVIKKYRLYTLKRKMQNADYESQLPTTVYSDDANMTLESLGESSKTKTDDDEPRMKIPLRRHLSRDGYLRRKRIGGRVRDYLPVHMPSKPRLLVLLHLALVMTKSQIQLSDLLRFIREGYLSYTIVSHFLPSEVQFGEGDINFINAQADFEMPTHAQLRVLAVTIAARLKLRSLPTPDLTLLLRRYATDLMLPDGFADLATVLLRLSNPPRRVKYVMNHGRPIMPSFELMALAPLLVLFKLLLGMDGVTERHLSHIANTINRLDKARRVPLFDFVGWQRALECRRAVLSVWHFPTRELIEPDAVFDAAGAVSFLQGIHRDPYLRSRLYKGKATGLHDRQIEIAVEKAMEDLHKTSSRSAPSFPSFTPSLTPGVSLLQDLVTWTRATGKSNPPWMDILAKDWNCLDVQYLLDLESYLPLLQKQGVAVKNLPCDWLPKYLTRADWIKDKLDKLNEAEQAKKYTATITKKKCIIKRKSQRIDHRFRRPQENVVHQRCDNMYWRLTPPKHEGVPWLVRDFEEEVLPQMPNSWSWLLTQCSRLLHITARDIYVSVMELEDNLIETFQL